MINRTYQRIKRVGICVITLCLMIGMCMPAVAHTNPVAFSLTATNGEVGDTVTVSMNISPESYFTNATFYLYYDTDAMEYVSDDLGSASPRGAMYMSNNFVDKGFLKAVYVTVSGIKNGGELVVFTFKVLKKTPAAFSLKMDECAGVEADDTTEFDLVYVLEGCIANDDGTGESPVTVTSPKTSVPANTSSVSSAVTALTGLSGSTATAVGSDSSGADAVPATTIVTVPVTVTDVNGIPVTNAEGIVQTTFITQNVTVTTTQNQSGEPENLDSQTQGVNQNVIWLCLAVLVAAAALAVAFWLSARRKKRSKNKNGQLKEPLASAPETRQTTLPEDGTYVSSDDDTTALPEEKAEEDHLSDGE